MDLKETLATLLPNIEISDEFVKKLSTSIETTVARRVDEETKIIQEKSNEHEIEMKKQLDEVTEKANAYAEYVVEEMTQKVEDYCDYVIKQFIEEQKEKLIETEEYCRMATVLKKIREAFESNYFQLTNEPASKQLNDKLDESKKEFNKLFEENRNLKRRIEDFTTSADKANRKQIFESLTVDLAETQKERLESLVEKTQFSTLEGFKEGLKLFVEEIKMTGKDQSKDTSKEKNDSSKQTSFQEIDNKMKIYIEKL